MPNEVSDTFHDIVRALGRGLDEWEKSFIVAVRSEFHTVEPDLIALGATFASQVLVAAATVASGGATWPQALESILPQIPDELRHLEHIGVTLLGLAVQKMKTP